MDPAKAKAAVEAARTLDRAGDTDGAVRTLVQAGNVDEAARILAGRGRYGDAAKTLLSGLDLKGGLEPARKKQALLAAIYFQKAGDVSRAVDLFLGLGERSRAVEALERAGDHAGAAQVRDGGAPASVGSAPRASMGAVGGQAVSALTAQKLEAAGQLDRAMNTYIELKRFGDAARLARQLGRIGEAANLYATGGMPYEAAECYFKAGDTGKSLENLVRVPRDHEHYRHAALTASRLAHQLNFLDMQLENFLGKFVGSGPQDRNEAEAFLLLAQLYERRDFPENAKDALRRVLAKDPAFGDAAARLAALEEQSKSGAMGLERILREDDSFRGRPAPKSAGRIVAPPLSPPAAPRASAPPPVSLILEAEPVVPASTSSGNTLFQVGGKPTAAAAVGSPTLFVAGGGDRAAGGPDGASLFSVGATVAKRYRLDELIGVGGMALVFRAMDLEVGDAVALKVFTQVIGDQSQMIGRIKQELRLSRQLTHPNIIRIHDMGMEQGHRYISMEVLTGLDLWSHVQSKPHGIGELLDFLIQTCAGLQEAHDRGIIHRDIKPENLFVTSNLVLKVMDFGLAKGSDAPSGLSRVGMIAGTPEYMAPEQINDFSAATTASDLYSLGVVAYKLFTGTVPFQHRDLMPLLMMHVNDRPEAPTKRNPELPVELERVILRLLEKEPEKRFESCRTLAQALSEIRVAQSWAAR